MLIFAPAQRAEMDANQASRTPKVRPAKAPRPLQNVRPVLDLGNTCYFNFRGRAYGVPPLPWKAGVAFQQIWVDALGQGTLTRITAPHYHALIARLPKLIWQYSRPVGRLRRALRFLGGLRNPFLKATEQELVELAGFFLQRRMTSGVGFPTAPATSPSPHRT